MPDAWVLIVERREPARFPLSNPQGYAYFEDVYGPFASQGEAWDYANSRNQDDDDELAHEVTKLLTPTVSTPSAKDAVERLRAAAVARIKARS